MNIIFDLGGVVFPWDFARIIDDVLNNVEKRNLIIEKLFHHKDWVEFDRGTISLEDVIERGAKRTKINSDEIELALNNIPNSLSVDNKTIEIIQKLKNTGKHKLFVLSNMPTEFTNFILEKFSFWNLFDGVVFSSRIKMVKPDLEIYNYLISKYSINPNDMIFIDDRKENLIPAASLGIKTIEFTSASMCAEKLKDYGVLEL